MFYRYQLEVLHNSVDIYLGYFSSINHLVRFASGFDNTECDLIAIDSLFEKDLPINLLIEEFEGVNHGI